MKHSEYYCNALQTLKNTLKHVECHEMFAMRLARPAPSEWQVQVGVRADVRRAARAQPARARGGSEEDAGDEAE